MDGGYINNLPGKWLPARSHTAAHPAPGSRGAHVQAQARADPGRGVAARTHSRTGRRAPEQKCGELRSAATCCVQHKRTRTGTHAHSRDDRRLWIRTSYTCAPQLLTVRVVRHVRVREGTRPHALPPTLPHAHTSVHTHRWQAPCDQAKLSVFPADLARADDRWPDVPLKISHIQK